MLRALEAATPALGITAYGLSLPTLEQACPSCPIFKIYPYALL